MKKFLSIALTLALVLCAIAMLGVVASAEEGAKTTSIVIPEFEFPTRPYGTAAELNIPASEIAAMIPKNTETKYEDGKFMIKDIGAAGAELYINGWQALNLVDGWWVFEMTETEYESFNKIVDFYGENHSWNIAYIDGNADFWFTIKLDQNTEVSVQIFESAIEARYGNEDLVYCDIYDGGLLKYHTVETYYKYRMVSAEYNYDGSLREFRVYDDAWYYYVPNFGWTLNSSTLSEVDPPAIFADMTFEQILALVPYGDFASTDEPDVDPIVIPEFEFPTRPYETADELNVPISEIIAMVPKTTEMKYEDGKFMIKDIGAARAEYFGGSSFQNMALVNGWWVCEVSEEEYESATKFAYFYGENNVWYTVYVNGTQESWFTIYHTEDVYINLILNYPTFAVCYSVGDYSYYDEYESNSLKLHAVETYYLDNIVKAEYNYDGSVRIFKAYIDEWYYCLPDIGWSLDVNGLNAIDPPEIFAGMTFEQLISLVPYGDFGNTDEPDVDTIVIPEFEFPTRPYETVDEINIPASEIAAMIPKNIEMKYENGKLMVNDIRAASAKYIGSTSWYTMDLVDGWWVCEISEEEYENSNKLVDFYGENDSWNMLYINGTANLWFTIYFNHNIYINVNIDSFSIEAVYSDGDLRYNDLYIGDYLDSHNVETYYMDKTVIAKYNYDGSLKEFRAYLDEWYYYVPEFGWTLDIYTLNGVDAPEIFAGMTEDELMALAPYGDFGNTDEPDVDPIVFPEFELPTRPYETADELNIPTSEIIAMIPKTTEMKYEDGKFMIKDIGAAAADLYINKWCTLNLVDGWWVYEVYETEYESSNKIVDFYGENNSWSIAYIDGKADDWLTISFNPHDRINVHIAGVGIEAIYTIGDFAYVDLYENGALKRHTVETYYMGKLVAAEYNRDGSLGVFRAYEDTWYYYVPNIGWSADRNGFSVIDAPEVFADMTFEQIASLAPYGDFGNSDEPDAEPIVFPEIEIPEIIYPTLSEAGINVEEIFNNAPKILERTYENGVLKIKNPGFPENYRISANIGGNWYYPTNEGDYYTLEISQEESESRIEITISTDFCQYYYVEFELTFVQFESYEVESEELYHKVLHLRTDGNHKVQYELSNGLNVSLCYEGDNLVSQVINITKTEYVIITTYNTDGTLKILEYYGLASGESGFYFAGQGWSSHLSQYIPADAPEMLKGHTAGQLMELAPSWGLCEHQWVDADCKAAKHCEKCGLWCGEALGHDWADADCNTPKTCSVCSETEGEALGHDWADADCDTPKTCSVCSETEGEALGHSWKDATVEAPKTCENCGATEGEPLPNPTPAPTPDTNVTPDGEAEEPHWFIKLINAIIDFFRKLFGLEK